jgi:fumarate hydratase subunit alpha
MSPLREIDCAVITDTVKRLFIEANCILGDDVLAVINRSLAEETTELGRDVLEKIIENAAVAKEETAPLCQDTGLAIVFAEIGQDVHVVGGLFNEAVQEGVRQAYCDGYLRKSVCDPFTRMNTGDNAPAIIHVEIVAGDRIRLIAMPKGGGSENMSSLSMLIPSAGIEEIKKHIIARVKEAGSNPCPPVIVGVGIGGSMEKAMILAKKSLLRPVGQCSLDGKLAGLEGELLQAINRLGIGPQGYGGDITALAVHIEAMPCHIASLPVAVNIQCHVARHKEAVL